VKKIDRVLFDLPPEIRLDVKADADALKMSLAEYAIMCLRARLGAAVFAKPPVRPTQLPQNAKAVARNPGDVPPKKSWEQQFNEDVERETRKQAAKNIDNV
jgi:hypothetical protein